MNRIKILGCPDSDKSDGIVLQKMTDAELPMFEKWLFKPHVSKWYREPYEWINEFKLRNAEFSFIHHFIAKIDSVPFGFCQYYVCRDSGENFNGYDKLSTAYSIDYLIGEETFLHRGYGKKIVCMLTEKIKSYTDAESIVVQPEILNEASRRLLLSCGFIHDKDKDIFVRTLTNAD